jgi:anhydro-N-acetylmuramic acid kinase
MAAPLLHDYPLHRSRVVIGLISGTSADGIDAAAVRFPAVGEEPLLEVLSFVSVPYPAEVRERVMLAASDQLSLRQTAVLGTELGHLFTEAALAVMPEQGCDLIASHGQTVCHLPQSATTLQIGDASVIAQRTGVITVADFRTADMACGGQGAPLVPLFDAYLLADPVSWRVAVNLGGIANLTVIPPGEAGGRAEGVSAWDTGPANCISDALCRLAGLGDFDRDGQAAAAGRVQEPLLAELLEHDYFLRPAPKSTGLEDFGEHYARALLERASLPDLLRTALALSAQTLVNDLARVARESRLRRLELVFAGGGTCNPVLMQEVRQRLETLEDLTLELRSFAEFGVPEEGREAAAFAFLGDRTARGLPGAAPGATGAARAAVLGKVSFPPQRAQKFQNS